jgi:hypothetical protein
MTTREQMTPTEVVTEVLRALNEQRWNDVAQYIDPLQLQEMLDRERESARRDAQPSKGMTVEDYQRNNPDAPLADAELLGGMLRSRALNSQIRFAAEAAAPEAVEFLPHFHSELYSPRTTVQGEVVRDDVAFVLYTWGSDPGNTTPNTLTLFRRPGGWGLVPSGEMFFEGGMWGWVDGKSGAQRPTGLAVTQRPWTSRTFDHQLSVDLFPSVLERFRSGPAGVTQIIAITPQRALTAKPGGKWSIQEHIGHLADLEELGERRLADFQARAEVLSAADMSNRKTEEARHNEANVWIPMQSFMEARAELVAKLEALPEEVIAHVALHPRLQRPMNVVEWVYFMCEHDDHHLAKMRAQAIELSGEIWDEVFGKTQSNAK